jgi:hypothetical protein
MPEVYPIAGQKFDTLSNLGSNSPMLHINASIEKPHEPSMIREYL